MRPALELGAGEQRFGDIVVEVGYLEPEEEELRVESGALLRDARHERASRRIRHVGGEMEVGEVRDPREDFFDALSLGDRGRKLRGREAGDLPVVAVAECRGGSVGLVDVGLDARILTAFVEIGEVPRDLFRTCQLRSRHGRDAT